MVVSQARESTGYNRGLGYPLELEGINTRLPSRACEAGQVPVCYQGEAAREYANGLACLRYTTTNESVFSFLFEKNDSPYSQQREPRLSLGARPIQGRARVDPEAPHTAGIAIGPTMRTSASDVAVPHSILALCETATQRSLLTSDKRDAVQHLSYS